MSTDEFKLKRLLNRRFNMAFHLHDMHNKVQKSTQYGSYSNLYFIINGVTSCFIDYSSYKRFDSKKVGYVFPFDDMGFRDDFEDELEFSDEMECYMLEGDPGDKYENSPPDNKRKFYQIYRKRDNTLILSIYTDPEADWKTKDFQWEYHVELSFFNLDVSSTFADRFPWFNYGHTY